MSFFYKVTLCEEAKRLSIYNWGCNMRCKICSYRIRSPYQGEKPIHPEEIKHIIAQKHLEGTIDRIHIIGGEPTTNPHLQEIVDFSNKIGLSVYLGHTNGSGFVQGIKEATISIKAIDKKLHLDYTGIDNKSILENVEKFNKAGIRVKANTVFVPEYVDREEIEAIARFLSRVSTDIPLHIIGYIPVPGLPYRKPEKTEMNNIVNKAKAYLPNVTYSLYESIDEISYGNRIKILPKACLQM